MDIDIAWCLVDLVPEAKYNQSETYELLQSTWFDERPIPSFEALEAEWVRIQEEQTREKDKKEIRAGLAISWTDLPAFIRAPYHGDFIAASGFLDAGDVDAAIARIEYADAKTGFTAEQVAVFNQVKADFKAAMESLR